MTILEKPKRDQVVAELRIMRKHLSPWLVAMHNAFYEEVSLTVDPTPWVGTPPRDPPAARAPCGG